MARMVRQYQLSVALLLLLHLFLLQLLVAALNSDHGGSLDETLLNSEVRISPAEKGHHSGGNATEEAVALGEEKGYNGNKNATAGGGGTAEEPELRDRRPLMMKFKQNIGDHGNNNKNGSEIGGEVIIGGLITVALGAVFFYIRVTRNSTNTASTGVVDVDE